MAKGLSKRDARELADIIRIAGPDVARELETWSRDFMLRPMQIFRIMLDVTESVKNRYQAMDEDSKRSMVMELFFYELSRLSRQARNRPALRLLREFLTPEQRKQLRNSRHVDIDVNGHRYRLIPGTGAVSRMRPVGQRWWYDTHYCLHEPVDVPKHEQVPPADRSLAHLLFLLNDEEWFLATANATPARSYLDAPRARRPVVEVEVNGQAQPIGCTMPEWA